MSSLTLSLYGGGLIAPAVWKISSIMLLFASLVHGPVIHCLVIHDGLVIHSLYDNVKFNPILVWGGD